MAGRNVAVLAVTTAQPPAGEWAPRNDAHPVLLADRKHVGFDGSDEKRVWRLFADEAFAVPSFRDPLGLDDLIGRKRRTPEVPNLSGPHQIGQRAERLVDVGVRLGPVDLVEVDPVGLQTAQTVEFLRGVKSFVEVFCERVCASVTGELLVGDRLGAGGTTAAETDTAHEGSALVAVLLPERFGAAAVALVDRDRPAGLATGKGGRF